MSNVQLTQLAVNATEPPASTPFSILLSSQIRSQFLLSSYLSLQKYTYEVDSALKDDMDDCCSETMIIDLIDLKMS